MLNEIKVLNLLWDDKVKACSILVELPIRKYLELTQENLNELDLQRKKLATRKHDVYKKLVEDLKYGTVIPPISLSLSKNSGLLEKLPKEKLRNDEISLSDIEQLFNSELNKKDITVLDGLQRTYCLLYAVEDLEKENPDDLANFYKSNIRAEIWIHISTNALLYKMLVLNTGQIKMSLRHQLEIINIPLREELEQIAENKFQQKISFSTYRNNEEVKDIYCYKLSNIVEAFTAFCTSNPIIDKSNVVVEELEKIDFIKDLDKNKFDNTNLELFVKVLLILDALLWKHYEKPMKEDVSNEASNNMQLTSRNNFINSTTFLTGFFAAVGKYKNDTKIGDRFNYIKELIDKDEENPLKLDIMSKILFEERGKSKKYGDEQRKFFFEAFREFIREEQNDFQKVWLVAANAYESR